ncbi:MAG: pyridoxamine 5'-phosphate oxidase family protein [Candidatus Schekmanbacteria bacterium]|nr:MAG: pyridoxamine 5'-phosphate oxidase family protein [Candidatus Schekmanbacteria bacterium]
MKTKSNVEALSEEEIDSFLKEQRVGILSLTNGESAYGIPLAYFYDKKTIYITLGPTGKKMEYIEKSKKVSFTVYWVPQDYPASRSWKSVIVEGELTRITDPDELRSAVKTAEKFMGMPEGSLDKILEMTLKNPGNSNFWKIPLQKVGGKGVKDFQEEFEE